jgi:hypothetical protein
VASTTTGSAGGLATETSLHIDSLDCDTDLEPLWLQAQAVPSASLLPCLDTLPPGWTVGNVAVNQGRSVLTLDHNQAGAGAVEIRLNPACDVDGSIEAPSDNPDVRHYQQTQRSTGEYAAVFHDRFAGGCVTTRLTSTTDLDGTFAVEATNIVNLVNRHTLDDALNARSHGRLHLDANPQS